MAKSLLYRSRGVGGNVLVRPFRAASSPKVPISCSVQRPEKGVINMTRQDNVNKVVWVVVFIILELHLGLCLHALFPSDRTRSVIMSLVLLLGLATGASSGSSGGCSINTCARLKVGLACYPRMCQDLLDGRPVVGAFIHHLGEQVSQFRRPVQGTRILAPDYSLGGGLVRFLHEGEAACGDCIQHDSKRPYVDFGSDVSLSEHDLWYRDV